jgi:hypothetical protein
VDIENNWYRLSMSWAAAKIEGFPGAGLPFWDFVALLESKI